MASNLTLQAWRWLEDITPHPLTYGIAERKHHALLGWASSEDMGHYRIQGTVTIDEEPQRRRVTLLLRRNMRVVAITWSDQITGEYVFESIANDDYCVICDDYGRTYNAAVADWVEPEAMET
jgi:hypothetical protein